MNYANFIYRSHLISLHKHLFTAKLYFFIILNLPAQSCDDCYELYINAFILLRI